MTPDPNYIEPAIGWGLATIAWTTLAIVEWRAYRRAHRPTKTTNHEVGRQR